MNDDLLEESVLRRSLRLDADEIPARFDPVALAAAAARNEPSRGASLVMVGGLVATAACAALVWQGIAALAPSALPAVLDAVIVLISALAALVVPLAETAAQPVIPASLLAVLAVVIAHELSERRELRHAHAS